MVEGGDKSDEAAYVARKIKEITNPETGLKITEKGKDMRSVRYGDIVIHFKKYEDNSVFTESSWRIMDTCFCRIKDRIL